MGGKRKSQEDDRNDSSRRSGKSNQLCIVTSGDRIPRQVAATAQRIARGERSNSCSFPYSLPSSSLRESRFSGDRNDLVAPSGVG